MPCFPGASLHLYEYYIGEASGATLMYSESIYLEFP